MTKYPSSFNSDLNIYYNNTKVVVTDTLGSPVGVGTTAGLNVNSNNAASTYQTLLSEAMPGVTTSTQIFANAPAATREIWLTVRGANLTIRTDGDPAVAGTSGCDFTKDSPAPYVLSMNQTYALLVRAVQNGGTSTGFIIYRG